LHVKKTLTIKPVDQRSDPPRLQRKGRGWTIAESRLDTLHDAAREMRRFPTPAQAALTDALSRIELGKYRFRRAVVIGSAIVDFACQSLRFVVVIDDEANGAPEIARRRDRSLAEVGIAVMHVAAADLLADADAVAAQVFERMRQRWQELRDARGAGRSAGRRPASTPRVSQG